MRDLATFYVSLKKQEKNEGFLPTARPGLFKRWWGGGEGKGQRRS